MTSGMPQVVARHAAARGGAPALRFGERSWSYAELDETARRAAAVLGALGAQHGDRVALYLPNVPEFVFAWLGTLHLGAVSVSLSTAWGPEQALDAIADSEPTVLVTNAELLRRLAASGAPLRTGRVLVVDEGADAVTSHAGVNLPLARWHELLGSVRARTHVQPVSYSAPASILYSSGTTGLPRGVVLPAGGLAGNAAAKAQHCGFREDDGVAVVVPLFHCYGQNAVLAAALTAGACAVLHRRFSPEALVEDASTGRVTALLAVPTVFQRLLELAERDAHAHAALRRLRFAFSAATTLPAPLAARWRDATGRSIQEGYGLTESGPLAAYNHLHTHVPGALGTPIPGVTMAVAEPESGRPLATDVAGEILIRSPYVMSGYWRRPLDTARAMRGGWLHTGDIGYRDPMGWFHLLERMDDLVKVSGFRVHPGNVERVLASHPAVRDAAAFGVHDAERGERVEAAVVLGNPSPHVVDDLLEHCRARLAPYEVPRRLHLRQELPRNAIGKVLRRELRVALSH